MANANSTGLEKSSEALVIHPLISSQQVKLPSKGKLKWLGGNLGLDAPVREDAIDDKGQWLEMDLKTVLERLDDFEGYRGNVGIKRNLLERCFIAYQYNLLTDSEKVLFESYVRGEIGSTTPLEAARAILFAGEH